MLHRLFAASLAVLIVLLAGSEASRADEIGPNDFRISHMGPDGETGYASGASSVAYNSVNDEFFAVWIGTDDVEGESSLEVFGQRIDAKTGEILGARVRLSDMGETESDTAAEVFDPPSVAYNSQDNQYLVVWSGDDIGGGGIGGNAIVDGKYEVYGQRVNAATGEEVGDNDFRISEMGTDDAVTTYGGRRPAAAYNSVDNDYLVVWIGWDASHAFGDSFGRLIDANDGSLGSQKTLRVPDPPNEPMGNTIEMDSSLTDVAYNPADDEYFVVFDCDCFGEGMGLAGVEIFGQRLDSNADGIGVEVRISNAGANTPGMSGRDPAIAFNTSESEYLTVWKANDAINKYEVFGQRLSPAGDQIGTNDFQISFSGAADDPDFNAGPPDVTYNSPNNEFLVVWSGDDDEGGLVDEEMEVFGQRVDGSFDAPADLINSNFRLSDINGIGTSDGFPPVVALAFNSTDNISLVIWSGTDDVPPLVAGEFEIFGQLLTDPECGNGLIEADEACDDGNTADDDGCSASCTEESSGTTGGGTTGGETTGTGSTGGTTGGSDSGGGCSLIR